MTMMDKAGTEALMLAALECFFHQLIYVCNVYPSGSFTKTTFLGITCQTNRHPGVVNYISSVCRIAAAASSSSSGVLTIGLILLNGGISESNEEEEEPCYELSINYTNSDKTTIRELEYELRNLILSVHAMKPQRSSKQGFRLVIKPTAVSPALHQAIANGELYQKGDSTTTKQFLLRPIHNAQISDSVSVSFVCRVSSSSSSSAEATS